MFDLRKSAARKDARVRQDEILRRLPRWGLVAGAVLALAIAYLTLTPVEELEDPQLFGLDKVYHTVAFAVLVFPVIATGPHRWVWLVPLAIAFGGAIELIQPHVGRGAEWMDFIANAVGVAVGVWLGRKAHRRLMARLAPPPG